MRRNYNRRYHPLSSSRKGPQNLPIHEHKKKGGEQPAPYKSASCDKSASHNASRNLTGSPQSEMTVILDTGNGWGGAFIGIYTVKQ